MTLFLAVNSPIMNAICEAELSVSGRGATACRGDDGYRKKPCTYALASWVAHLLWWPVDFRLTKSITVPRLSSKLNFYWPKIQM